MFPVHSHFFCQKETSVEMIETQQKGKWENPGVFCIYPFPHNPRLVLTTHRLWKQPDYNGKHAVAQPQLLP